MAVMSLRLCRYSTIRLLCAGSTRAKQRAVVQVCRCRCGGSSSNSRPVRQMTVPSCSSSCSVMIPTLRQIDRAVPLLSPWTKDKITCSRSLCEVSCNRAYKLTCDHDDSNTSLSTHSDGPENLFSRGVQHAHATYKGQIRLGNRGVGLGELLHSDPLLQYSCTNVVGPHLVVNEGSCVLQVKAAQVGGRVPGRHSQATQCVSARSPVSYSGQELLSNYRRQRYAGRAADTDVIAAL